MALTKRSTKGTALTHEEMDANFTHLGGDGTYVMPTTDGDSGQVMSTNGSGQVSFTTLTGVTATIANAYPVGSIYINATNATNPGTLLGFGTWVAFATGRMLVAFDSSDGDYDTAEETGGSVGGGVVYEWNLTSSSYVGLMIKVDNNESIARVTAHDGSNNNTSSFQTDYLGSGRYLKFAFTYQCQ